MTKAKAKKSEREKVIATVQRLWKEKADEARAAKADAPDTTDYDTCTDLLASINDEGGIGTLEVVFDHIANVYSGSDGSSMASFHSPTAGVLVVVETDVRAYGDTIDDLAEYLADIYEQAEAIEAKLAPARLYTPEIAAALESVLDYQYADEEKNYEENDRKGPHIFLDLKALNEFEHAVRDARA